MIPWHLSDWSLNELHVALGYEIDRGGEHVMLRRGRESRLRGGFDHAAWNLCMAGEIEWWPRMREYHLNYEENR